MQKYILLFLSLLPLTAVSQLSEFSSETYVTTKSSLTGDEKNNYTPASIRIVYIKKPLSMENLERIAANYWFNEGISDTLLLFQGVPYTLSYKAAQGNKIAETKNDFGEYATATYNRVTKKADIKFLADTSRFNFLLADLSASKGELLHVWTRFLVLQYPQTQYSVIALQKEGNNYFLCRKYSNSWAPKDTIITRTIPVSKTNDSTFTSSEGDQLVIFSNGDACLYNSWHKAWHFLRKNQGYIINTTIPKDTNFIKRLGNLELGRKEKNVMKYLRDEPARLPYLIVNSATQKDTALELKKPCYFIDYKKNKSQAFMDLFDVGLGWNEVRLDENSIPVEFTLLSNSSYKEKKIIAYLFSILGEPQEGIFSSETGFYNYTWTFGKYNLNVFNYSSDYTINWNYFSVVHYYLKK